MITEGIFLHVNVVDNDTLLDAMSHPDRYPTLSVRVSGWSARFASLNREYQQMIINRTGAVGFGAIKNIVQDFLR